MPGQRSQDKAYVSGWLPEGLVAWIQGEARRVGRTVTDILVEAISDYRDEHQKEGGE